MGTMPMSSLMPSNGSSIEVMVACTCRCCMPSAISTSMVLLLVPVPKVSRCPARSTASNLPDSSHSTGPSVWTSTQLMPVTSAGLVSTP